MRITYTTGDATAPVGEGNKIICHICNDVGAWGAGFVLAISRRWPIAEREYRDWVKFRNKGGGPGEMPPFELEQIQVVAVEGDIWVCNMIAQAGFSWINGRPPIRYDALRQCLRRLGHVGESLKASIHMPRIGCGIAGGTWNEIEPLIQDELSGLTVTVYDLL